MNDKIIEVKQDYVIVLKPDGTYVRKPIMDEWEYEKEKTLQQAKRIKDSFESV